MTAFVRSDQLLRSEVEERLLSCGDVDTHNFEISVDTGVVRLEGEVPGRHQKKVVSECLADVPGVKNVENRLKIRRVSRFSDNSMHGF